MMMKVLIKKQGIGEGFRGLKTILVISCFKKDEI